MASEFSVLLETGATQTSLIHNTLQYISSLYSLDVKPYHTRKTTSQIYSSGALCLPRALGNPTGGALFITNRLMLNTEKTA